VKSKNTCLPWDGFTFRLLRVSEVITVFLILLLVKTDRFCSSKSKLLKAGCLIIKKFFSRTLRSMEDAMSLQEDIKAWNHLCEICHNRQATQRHHKFSQTKQNRKKYGKLLDERFNILYVCADCHSSHAKITDEHRLTEQQFINLVRKLTEQGNGSLRSKFT